MASLKTNSVEKNLKKKGFVQADTHHHYFEFYHDGKIIAKTYTSHSGKDINDYLITQMSKQCLMKKNFFIDFAKCEKTKEDYIAHLKENDHL